MKRLLLAGVLVLSSGTVALGAQGPGGRRPGADPVPRPGAMGRGATGGGALNDPAEFLLAHTGELRLTDAQVTRLAAIARRSADRRQTLRARMDSVRTQRPRGERPDSATRAQMRQRFEQLRPEMERLRDQSQADRRDAIAVLTPDQQAQAWERIARVGQPRGGRPDRGFAGPGRRGAGNGAAPGRPGRGGSFGPRPGDGPGPPADGRRPGRRPRPEIES